METVVSSYRGKMTDRKDLESSTKIVAGGTAPL